MKKEITEQFERMPTIEKRLGVSIEALNAVLMQYEEETFIKFMFDIVGEPQIERSLFISAAAYNSKGQLVGKGEVGLLAEEFIGLESMELVIECEGVPAKFRLFPKPINGSPNIDTTW